MEFAFDFTDKDFNYCQAITDMELYTSQSLFSLEALHMQTHEFAVIMKDFADLAGERRGLFFNVLPQAKFFRDNYYSAYIREKLQGENTDKYPEFLHFSGHQENVAAILRLLDYAPANFKKLDPSTSITFNFYRQHDRQQSDTHVQVLLNRFDTEGNVESEILPVFDCESQMSGGVKVSCFLKRMQQLLLSIDFNDVRQWCKIDVEDRIAKDRDVHGAMLPSEFKAGLLETFDLKEEYAKYIRLIQMSEL